VLCFPDTLW